MGSDEEVLRHTFMALRPLLDERARGLSFAFKVGFRCLDDVFALQYNADSSVDLAGA